MYSCKTYLTLLIETLSQEREEKREREFYLIVSVLGDQEEEETRGGRRSLSRANHLHASLEFLQVLSWRRGKYIKP